MNDFIILVWYEPTDVHKALKIFHCESEWQKVLRFVSPNVNELILIARHFKIETPSDESAINLKVIKNIAENLVEKVPVVIATLGAQGVLVARNSNENEPFLNKENNVVEVGKVQSHLYSPLNIKDIVSVSGCGDCLAAGIITGLLRGWKESDCLMLGLHAAKQSLMSYETVPQTLVSLQTIENNNNFKN